MNVLLHNRQKSITKIFILTVFFIGSLLRTHLRNEVTQKGERVKGSKESVTRLRIFLEVSPKFDTTNSWLLSVLRLRTHLESMSNREERRPFL